MHFKRLFYNKTRWGGNLEILEALVVLDSLEALELTKQEGRAAGLFPLYSKGDGYSQLSTLTSQLSPLTVP